MENIDELTDLEKLKMKKKEQIKSMRSYVKLLRTDQDYLN